ncbi:MAG: hypothetical protein OXB95_10555, partial [Rhodobacteraceae bacterium]|nr:hypothetical protein [Paracoccaceae bacterium]
APPHFALVALRAQSIVCGYDVLNEEVTNFMGEDRSCLRNNVVPLDGKSKLNNDAPSWCQSNPFQIPPVPGTTFLELADKAVTFCRQ